ncbi:MAG TPA: serine protease [Polyangiaceae bacterium]|nr:serine protease [Polyangiaceae bacterium]
MRTRTLCVVALAASPFVAALSGACGGAQPVVPTVPSASAPTSSATAKTEPKGLQTAPRVCNGRKLMGEMVAQLAENASLNSKKEATKDVKKDDKSGQSSAEVAKGGGSFQTAYKSISPATVVMKAKDGFGTGVIVDKSGLVLTNYHVVAHGMKKDFTIEVKLNLGKPSKTGGMDLDEKNYEAVVVKADRVRDMALVRIKDAPKDLPVAKISKADPAPGMPVAAIGHAGIGMLWAMKTCHVSAVGEPARNSIIAAKDCSAPSETSGMSDDDLRRLKEQCENTKKEAQKAISNMLEGLFVQSDCRVAPGDSGGPLITDQGELVGINQSISADRGTGSGTSYHVHVAEIREFTTNVPQDAVQLPPDPWCDGGTETTLEDIDMDGKPEALMASSMEMRGFFAVRRFALMMDLDENHGLHDHAEELKAGKTNMPYDAEVGLLSLPQGTYVWYDSNDDDNFDILLSDPEDKGHPVAAYDIGKDGKLTERKPFVAPYYFDTAFLPKNEIMHEHLGRLAILINPKYANAELIADGKASLLVPDPVNGIPPKGRLTDGDRDGKPDSYSFQSAFVRGVVFDADQDSLGSLDVKDDPSPLIQSRRFDPEMAFLMQKSAIWVVYDTDNDGQQDLALVVDPNSTDRIVTSGYTRAAGGNWALSNDHVGLKGVRPSLVPAAPRLARLASGSFPFLAPNEGLGALPTPMPPRAGYEFAKDKKKDNKAVILGERGDYSYILIDADRDTKIGAKEDADDLMRDGKFDADVAVVRENDMSWVFYDTDQDKAFDLVLFSNKSGVGASERAFRIEGGRLRADPGIASGKLYRHKDIFKSAKVATGFKKIAADVLPSFALEQ